MEGMGIKFIPVIARRLLGPLSMFGPILGASWTHIASPNNPNGRFNLSLAAHPPHYPPHPLPRTHLLICATYDIAVVVKESCTKPRSVS